MNTPSPLVPQGTLLDQKNKSRARVKVAFFTVVGVHVAVILTALLAQGCKRDPVPEPVPVPEADQPAVPEVADTMPTFDAPEPVIDPPGSNYVAPQPDPVPPQPVAVTQEHLVQRGDSFYSLGLKYGVTMRAIQDANPTVNPNRLQVGQRLVIPAPSANGGTAGPAPTTGANGMQIYVVKSGDNLTKIAAQHGTTINAIRQANNLVTDRINVGDRLKIPTASPAPPR